MRMTLSELGFTEGVPLFESPFPAYDTPKAASRLKSLSGGAGDFSLLQAESWQSAQRITNARWLTAPQIGGAPISMLRKILPSASLAEADLPPSMVEGANIFATAVFNSTTNIGNLTTSIAEVGLEVALDATTAVPLAGPIFKAVVGFATFMAKLKGKKTQVIRQTIPWFHWEKNLETDMVNLVGREVIPTVDWTRLWMPPFNASNLELRPGPSQVGDKATGWGAWDVSNQPSWGDGFGMLPGLQQGIGVMQCARDSSVDRIRDVVSNSTDFLPSATQQATGAWSMVNEFGSPLMYQVQARKLGEEWETWWDNFFGEGLDYLTGAAGGVPSYWETALSKILARWLCFKESGTWFVGLNPSFIESAGNLPSFINGDIFSKDKNKLVAGRQYYGPDKIIKKACNDLAKAQISALGRSVVSALVRPKAVDDPAGGTLPAFAAFEDPGPPMQSLTNKGYNHSTFGKQLKAYALDLRKILETHPDRYTLDRRDVEAVDPEYVKKLQLPQMPFGAATHLAAFPVGGQDTKPPPSPAWPQGQPSFTWGEDKKPPRVRPSNLGRNLAIGAVVVGGALAYKYRDELKQGAQAALEKIQEVT